MQFLVQLKNISLINPNFRPYVGNDYYVSGDVEAEVLTVHFAKRTMRVRYTDLCGKIQTKDVDAQPFFNAYQITSL